MLKEIQTLEDKLIYSDNCGSFSTIFTEMMYKTSEWIDKEASAKAIHISPFKAELDKQVDLVAYYIETGMDTTSAVKLLGTNESDWYKRLTDTHRRILWAARKVRTVNKNKHK